MAIIGVVLNVDGITSTPKGIVSITNALIALTTMTTTKVEVKIAISSNCGATKSYNEILNDIDRDLWLEPKEAIEYGLADEILTPETWASWIEEEE